MKTFMARSRFHRIPLLTANILSRKQSKYVEDNRASVTLQAKLIQKINANKTLFPLQKCINPTIQLLKVGKVDITTSSQIPFKGLFFEKNEAFQKASDQLKEWIGDDSKEFDDWNQAFMMAWLAAENFDDEGKAELLTKYAYRGNCHGFTFGDDNEEIAIETMEDVRRLWDGKTPIAVCLKGGVVAHTAKMIGGRCHQTLPDGPRFITSLDFLKKVYDEVIILSPDSDEDTKDSSVEDVGRDEFLSDFKDFE